MHTPEQILKQYWGYESFRPLQREIIDSIIAPKDTLALLPTGGGKSVCYQVPALINEGVCLVISPLIALMRDQVQRLKNIGIPAECIHSGLHYNEVKRILSNTVHAGYKLLYVSPERLQTELFKDHLPEFNLSMIAVDEAHCISQWGHDFRPDYIKIAEVRNVFPDVPILALTATATTEVQEDIIKYLSLNEVNVFRQSFKRNNIFYDVRYCENKAGETLKKCGNECSIIYCRSRKQTETIARQLLQSGINAIAYHAGMNKDLREEAQEKWMSDATPIMAATTAFGMGIDKPDVRMVLHYDAPEHLEAYYQEAGRAGRDGLPSIAITLYNSTDLQRLTDSIALRYPPEEYLRRIYQAVAEYLQIPIGSEPDRYYAFDVFDFCQKFPFQVNPALHALKLLEQEGLWTLSEAVYSPATVRFLVSREMLDNIGQTHPDLGYLIIGLLRMYGSIFHFPTSVRETAIARTLKLTKEQVEQTLMKLHSMDILEYNKPGEGPQLFFHHYRVDSRYLIIDLKRIALLRKQHEQRTKAMVHFLENSTECRERLLLAYFGETATSDCGHCDICRNKYQAPDRTSLRNEIVSKLGDSGLASGHIAAGFPEHMKNEVLSLLREMIDEGQIIHKNGLLFRK